jgi:hypothetical protein
MEGGFGGFGGGRGRGPVVCTVAYTSLKGLFEDG